MFILSRVLYMFCLVLALFMIFYSKKVINKLSLGISLRMRSICDGKFIFRSTECNTHLLVRDYKPSAVNRNFDSISYMSEDTVLQYIKMSKTKSSSSLV